MLPCDTKIRPYESHGRNASQAYDDLGLNELDLLPQIADTGILLLGERIAIVGRAAFENVGDIHRFAGDADGVQVAIEQLTRSAHKGNTLFVLRLSGCLKAKISSTGKHLFIS